MIRLTTPKSSGYTTHYVSPQAVARITESGPSSQWHGIRAFVKLFDGTLLECNESADSIREQIEQATKE